MGTIIQQITTWQFLNEPLWRWFFFTLCIMLFLIAWSGVLKHM